MPKATMKERRASITAIRNSANRLKQAIRGSHQPADRVGYITSEDDPKRIRSTLKDHFHKPFIERVVKAAGEWAAINREIIEYENRVDVENDRRDSLILNICKLIDSHYEATVLQMQVQTMTSQELARLRALQLDAKFDKKLRAAGVDPQKIRDMVPEAFEKPTFKNK